MNSKLRWRVMRHRQRVLQRLKDHQGFVGIYCPYIPLTSSGVTADPYLYQSLIKFVTRYGFVRV